MVADYKDRAAKVNTLAAIFVEKFFSISYIQRYLLYFFFQISEQSPPVNVALPLANNLNPILIAC